MKRLVRHECLLGADPVDGVVGQVLGQVAALLWGSGRLDRIQPLVQSRIPLVVLAADEPVKYSNPPPPKGHMATE